MVPVTWDVTYKGTDEQYGTVPNILDFINLTGEENGLIPNKLFLRLRILQILDRQPIKNTLIVDNLAQYYEIHEDDIDYEIDELILMGLISWDEESDLNDPILSVTSYWKMIKNIFLQRDPFLGLITSTTVPNLFPFRLKEYENFVTIPPYAINNEEFRSYRIRIKSMAFAYELIVTSLMSHYIKMMEKIEEERYNSLPHSKNKLSSLLDVSRKIPFDKLSISNDINNLTKQILLNRAGLSFEHDDVKKMVITILSEHARLLSNEIQELERR